MKRVFKGTVGSTPAAAGPGAASSAHDKLDQINEQLKKCKRQHPQDWQTCCKDLLEQKAALEAALDQYCSSRSPGMQPLENEIPWPVYDAWIRRHGGTPPVSRSEVPAGR